MVQSNELYRELGGIDLLTIQQKVEKEKIEPEQPKNKETETKRIVQNPQKPKKQDQSEPKSKLLQWVDEQLSYGGY